jgi:hypothetical protein
MGIVYNDGKRCYFVTKVGPRGVCVFYEVKISATEILSFYKPSTTNEKFP